MSYVTNSRMIRVTLRVQIQGGPKAGFCEDFDITLTFGSWLTPV